eukprot:390051_1
MSAASKPWNPKEYASKKSILIVGDMDLSFACFLMKHLPTSTNVTNTSLLSEDQLIENKCSRYQINKIVLTLYKYRNIQIKHNIDVKSMSKLLNSSMFDCVLFIYPQATNSSSYHKKKQFDDYHQVNARLLEDYIKNASDIIFWNGQESQIDFVIKANHVTNWITKRISNEFKTWWYSKFDVSAFNAIEFQPSHYTPYKPLNERGKEWEPGLSFMISSKAKESFRHGLNIEFEYSNNQMLIAHAGYGTFDLRRDYKKAYCDKMNMFCPNLNSIRKLYLVHCVANIEGETYDNGQTVEYNDQTFTYPNECCQIMNQQFSWLIITAKHMRET